MSSIFGNRIRTTVFGESHGEAIGVVVEGLPAGEKIDFEELQKFLQRRAPGRNLYTTQRREADVPEFLSGVKDSIILGSPLAAIIRNKGYNSRDYNELKDVPRPSHADYTAHVKYKGHMDMRGGGPFSGRLTAPLCIAGGIAIQILKKRGVHIGAHILRMGNISDAEWDNASVTADELYAISNKDFPVISDKKSNEMIDLINKLKEDGDSVGGIIECMSIGIPAGIGGLGSSSVESSISSAMFSVPGIRGIEFGAGFKAAEMHGSEHNDQFEIKDGLIKTITNNAGGVNGGITNGMPLSFKVAVKPTSSIAKPQKSFSLSELTEKELLISGRHDPCIAVRAVPVIEAVCALVLLDLWEE
ncbi:MAG: chorismate synthase [Gudongella sp.]|nr:chorismate synthase [Gudongella sp.]